MPGLNDFVLAQARPVQLKTVARFAFFTPPYAGHVNPMIALAAELASRGHDCSVVGQADLQPVVERAGIAMHTVGEATHPPGTLRQTTERVARLSGLFGLRPVIRDVARTTDMLCRETPAVLTASQADAVVSDQLEAAGGLVAARLGLPCVSVANALLINREPAIPPPFSGWTYKETRWGIERNRGGYRVSDWLMRPVRDVIGAWAGEWGLGPWRMPEDCLPPIQIAQLPAALDFPRRSLRSGLTYVGPLRRPDGSGADMPVTDNRRPLVFASLGTLQGSRFDIFYRIAQACEALGLQLVIAHGGRLDDAQAARLPGAPIVRAFVPQRQVIARAALVITHGGMNTVLDALSVGAPLIVIPIAMEQGAIAQRVRRCGAGEIVSRRWLTASALKRAIAKVTSDWRYKASAEVIARAIEQGGGVRRAADIVEASLGSLCRAAQVASHA